MGYREALTVSPPNTTTIGSVGRRRRLTTHKPTCQDLSGTAVLRPRWTARLQDGLITSLGTVLATIVKIQMLASTYTVGGKLIRLAMRLFTRQFKSPNIYINRLLPISNILSFFTQAHSAVHSIHFLLLAHSFTLL
ncbi:Uncharacterized protein Y057_4449 [Fusarium fujikuroi]|nr:Uncharacterized protein Y057_4449 [Fusarium fujikuroi]